MSLRRTLSQSTISQPIRSLKSLVIAVHRLSSPSPIVGRRRNPICLIERQPQAEITNKITSPSTIYNATMANTSDVFVFHYSNILSFWASKYIKSKWFRLQLTICGVHTELYGISRALSDVPMPLDSYHTLLSYYHHVKPHKLHFFSCLCHTSTK